MSKYNLDQPPPNKVTYSCEAYSHPHGRHDVELVQAGPAEDISIISMKNHVDK